MSKRFMNKKKKKSFKGSVGGTLRGSSSHFDNSNLKPHHLGKKKVRVKVEKKQKGTSYF